MEQFGEDRLQPSQQAPRSRELPSARVTAAVKLETALQVVAFGALALLIAFAAIEGLRLAMLLSRTIGPGDARWFVLSGFQQVGWHFMLACYGVLLTGLAVLQVSTGQPGGRSAAFGAIVCLGLALGSRAALIAGVPHVEHAAWQTFLLEATITAETLCVLGALLAFDLFTRGLAGELDDAGLKASATSHAVLVACLAAALLLSQFIEVEDFRGAVQRTGQLLRLSLGGICLAWTFRLGCDARSALRAEGASADQ